MNDIKISIIIVNFNTPNLVINCIESIFHNVHSCKYEIIVIDNASIDESVKIIRARFLESIKVIESTVNLGFGRANNLGVKHASGDFLFLLNSDTLLENDPFPYFIEAYENSDNVAFLGGYLIDGDRKPCSSGGRGYSIKKDLGRAYSRWIGKKYTLDVKPSDQVTKVDFVIGADMFIRKSTFELLGGFDPRIFMYLEEVKLCMLALEKGFNNYIIPGPQIIHLEKRSSRTQFARIHYTASLMYCIKQKSNSLVFRLFQLTYLISKIPLLLNFLNFKRNIEYVRSIIYYKKYLVKQNIKK